MKSSKGLVPVLTALWGVALLLIWALLRFATAQVWFLALGQFLPPHGYLLGLAPLALVQLVFGPRRLLWATAGYACFVVVFLMGAQLSWPENPPRQWRVLSFNVNSAYSGPEAVAEKVLAESPDLVLLQEVGWLGDKVAAQLRARLPYQIVYAQFVIASRTPLAPPTVPEAAFFWGRLRQQQFIRTEVLSPAGPTAVYNIHPGSPRHAFMELRRQGFKNEILSGRIWDGPGTGQVMKLEAIRGFELRSAGAAARAERLPVLIAGDFNVPETSPLFREAFGWADEAFDAAGVGFGFSFPSNWPFLRLDRILSSPPLSAVNYRVGCAGVSDHLCVIADYSAEAR